MPQRTTIARGCAFPDCPGDHRRTRDYCSAHYAQLRRGRKLQPVGYLTALNRVFHDGTSWCIELRAGDRITGAARISRKDVPRVRGRRWWLMSIAGQDTQYAYTTSVRAGKRINTYLHRLLMAPGRMMVDHKNGDGLDCRRSNMRVVTRQQNQENMRVQTRSASGHRGVYWDTRRRGYFARAQSKGRVYREGPFNSIDKAIRTAKALRDRVMTHHVEARCHRKSL